MDQKVPIRKDKPQQPIRPQVDVQKVIKEITTVLQENKVDQNLAVSILRTMADDVNLQRVVDIATARLKLELFQNEVNKDGKKVADRERPKD